MNPYESPAPLAPPSTGEKAPGRPTQHSWGIGFIAFSMLLATAVGFVSPFVPSIRSFAMPRFGWGGLILCMNPLIFLFPALRKPERPGLLAAAVMSVALGLVNAAQLLSSGTVSVVKNEFADRLHSSWLWSVLPFLAAAVYLFWCARGAVSRRLTVDTK